MKRIISLILILTVLLSLTACGNKKDNATEGTLTERYETVLAEATQKAVNYLCENVKEPNFGSVGGEWTVMGLARANADISDEYFEMYFQNQLCMFLFLGFLCFHIILHI